MICLEKETVENKFGVNWIRKGLFAITMLAAGVMAGYLLMVLVFLLPTEPMRANMVSSAELFDKEREYHRVIPGYISTQLDNYTDAWMVGNAVFSNQKVSVWKQALACSRAEYGEGPLDGLLRYVSGESGYTEIAYTRYWHGYLVLLKPLFLLFDYADLRVINIFAEGFLVFAVFGAFWKRGFVREGAAYVVSLLFLMPIVVPMSIQFSVVFYIANTAMLVLLKWYEKIEGSGHVMGYFQLVGMLTSFCDLLTYPIAALGLPLVCLIKLQEGGTYNTCNKRIWSEMKCIIGASVNWGFGYGAMWASKWVLSSIILGDDTIANAVSQIVMRSAREQEGQAIDVFEIWRRNVEFYFEKPYLIIIVLSILGTGFVLLRHRNTLKKLLLDALPFVVIACMPFVWYAIAGQHSYEHHWFTFRGLIVSVFACLCCLCSIHKNQS